MKLGKRTPVWLECDINLDESCFNDEEKKYNPGKALLWIILQNGREEMSSKDIATAFNKMKLPSLENTDGTTITSRLKDYEKFCQDHEITTFHSTSSKCIKEPQFHRICKRKDGAGYYYWIDHQLRKKLKKIVEKVVVEEEEEEDVTEMTVDSDLVTNNDMSIHQMMEQQAQNLMKFQNLNAVYTNFSKVMTMLQEIGFCGANSIELLTTLTTFISNNGESQRSTIIGTVDLFLNDTGYNTFFIKTLVYMLLTT